MDVTFAYVTCWLFCLILLLLFLYFKRAMKAVEGLPYYPVIPEFLYDHVAGKIPKDDPFFSYVIYRISDICHKFKKEGFFATFWTVPVIFIFSEESIKFFTKEKSAVDKPPEYKFVEDSMGAGLATSNGERWKTHRKLINPAFHIGLLKDKIPLFNDHALALVKDMEKMVGKQSVNLLNVLKTNYFNALSESVFGLKQCEENRAENLKCRSLIDSLNKMAAKRIIFPWLRPKLFLNFSTSGRTFLKQNKEYKNFITKKINDIKKQVTSDESDGANHFGKHLQHSFTYNLLNYHLNDPSFTFQDLHDEVSTILITGYDSVSYTTLWCLFMLALHPEVQETAFQEVQSKTGCYVTYEESCDLTYLEAVIMETLRLYPILPVFAKVLSDDVQYGKYKVHKGTRVFFLPFASHKNADIYPDPDKFDPERFLNSDLRKNWSFFPFSEGKRSCVGKKYGVIEMKIFLAYILRNFKITSLDKKEDIRVCWTINLIPARNIRMKITPRHTEERY